MVKLLEFALINRSIGFLLKRFHKTLCDFDFELQISMTLLPVAARLNLHCGSFKNIVTILFLFVLLIDDQIYNAF